MYLLQIIPFHNFFRYVDSFSVYCFCRNVNNDVMEMLIMAYAFKTSSARRIIGVVPYLPYSKQSKMRKRGCIVAKLLAQMMSMSGELKWNQLVCHHILSSMSKLNDVMLMVFTQYHIFMQFDCSNRTVSCSYINWMCPVRIFGLLSTC